MIHLLLEEYMSLPSSKLRMNRIDRRYCILTIICFIFDIAFLMLHQGTTKIVFIILFSLSIIATLIIIVLWEKYDLGQCREKIDNQNSNLDGIKNILESFQYGNNNTNNNWYSAEKIKYLIQSGEAYIEKVNGKKNTLYELFKTMIFSIVSFIVVSISSSNLKEENDLLKIVILIAFFVLILLIFFCLVSGIINFVTNLILKSSSIKNMEKLISSLKDLLARDFENELD